MLVGTREEDTQATTLVLTNHLRFDPSFDSLSHIYHHGIPLVRTALVLLSTSY